MNKELTPEEEFLKWSFPEQESGFSWETVHLVHQAYMIRSLKEYAAKAVKQQLGKCPHCKSKNIEIFKRTCNDCGCDFVAKH